MPATGTRHACEPSRPWRAVVPAVTMRDRGHAEEAGHEGHPRSDPGGRPPPTRSPRCRSLTPTAPPRCTRTRSACSPAGPPRDKDPRESIHVEDVAHPGARPGRGAGRGHGQRDQLQHRLDLDLRAGLDVRLPQAVRQAVPAGQAPRPALPRDRLGPGRRRAAHRPRACTPGSPATRWSPTACRSSWSDPDGHNDTMLDPEQRIWGFETNFGGLAHLALVKANQLMPKPDHLTWEEAASPGLVNSTAYRQLVSAQRRPHEAGRRRPDLGRQRRSRLVRHPVGARTAARSRSAWCPARTRRRSAARWAPS